MKPNQLLIYLSASLTVFSMTLSEAGCQNNVDKPRASMNIVELSHRIDSRESRGFLKVQIKNEGSKEMFVRFCGTLSFGGYAILEHKGQQAIPSYCYVNPYGYRSAGGSFSIFEYEWRKPAGSIVESGSYDKSRPNCSLKPNDSLILDIPILLPSRPGRYILHARFDNRQMKNIVESRSSSTEECYLGLFDLETETEILIPEKKELSRN